MCTSYNYTPLLGESFGCLGLRDILLHRHTRAMHESGMGREVERVRLNRKEEIYGSIYSVGLFWSRNSTIQRITS